MSRNSPSALAAALGGILALSAPHARADIIGISGPGPGGIPPDMVGAITEPLIPGAGMAGDTFPIFSNANFSVTGTVVSAFNTGVPFLSLTTTVTDKLGGSMDVIVDLTQGYTELLPFFGIAIMTTTYNEPGAPAGGRGDTVTAIVSNVGNQAIVSSFDFEGLNPTDISNLVVSGGGSPDIDANVSFDFAATSAAGDSISIPLTFEMAPEPGSLPLLAAAFGCLAFLRIRQKFS